MKATIIAPRAATKPQLPDGSTNPLFFLVTDARNMGVEVEYHGNMVHLIGVTSQEEFTMSIVNTILSVGGDVLNYPVFIELTPTAYAKDLPDYFPNRATLDIEGNEVVKKWSDLNTDIQQHTELNGKMYVASTPYGEHLPASVWSQLDTLTGVNVLTVKEWIDLQPAI